MHDIFLISLLIWIFTRSSKISSDMFMICMLLYFFIQIQIPCRALSQSSTRNVTVRHGETANLTFDLRNIANTSILQMEYMSIVYFIGKKSALRGITSDFTIVENNLDRFSFSIQNASKQNKGRYCLVVKDERHDYNCVQLIIYEEKKTVTERCPNVSIYQETGRIEDGNIGLICDAKWSTDLETHDSTIFYGWFKDDVYITSNRKLTLDDEYIPKARDIICLATDDYDCGRLMDGINKTITQKVKMDKRCEGVLGISPVYTQKSNYRLEIMEPNNTVKEVIVGKTVTIRWTITGYPKPIIKPAFNKSHSGVGHHFIDVSMVKTQTRHEYSLTLTIPVISKYDLVKYCIQVKSKKETLNLCQTLTESSIVSEQISVPIVITAAVVFFLVICLVILVTRVCQGKQAIVSEDISLSEVGGPYEIVTEDDVIESLTSRRSTPSLLRHTMFTSSLSTIHPTNQPDDTSSSTSSDSSHHTNKKQNTSTCTNLSIIVNYSSDTSKSSLTTNTSDTTESTSDYFNPYDQLNPQSQVSPTDNYQKLKV